MRAKAEIFHNKNNDPLELSPQGSGGVPNMNTFKVHLDSGWDILLSPCFCQERLEQMIPDVCPNLRFSDPVIINIIINEFSSFTGSCTTLSSQFDLATCL